MSVGLLTGSLGGAVAWADSDGDSSSGSSQSSDGSAGEGQASTSSSNTPGAASTRDTATETNDDKGSDATSTSSTGSAVVHPTSTLSAQTNTSSDADDTAPTTSASSAQSTAAEPEIPAITEVATEVPVTTEPQVPVTYDTPVVSQSPPIAYSAAIPDPVEAAPSETNTVVAAHPAPIAATSDLSHVAITAPVALPAAQPTITMADALAYLQDLLASATDVVGTIMQLPADVSAALGIPSDAPGIGAEHGPTAVPYTPAVGLLNVIHAPPPRTHPVVGGGAPTADFRDVAENGGIVLLTSELPQPAAPAAPPADAAPPHSSVPAMITGAVTALVVSVSVWALISAALPGLGGLVAFGATGVRIGYRQASAGMALHTTDLARFARTGPIGIVRTGSLVAVHSRRTATGEPPRRRHLKSVA